MTENTNNPDIIEISIVPNNKELITASDIDNSNKSIDAVINDRLLQFNKKRKRKIIKQMRDERRVELNDSSFILSKIDVDTITNTIANDEISIDFIEKERINISIEKINYFEIRQVVNGLNDMNEYSSEMERREIQTLTNFRKLNDLVTHSMRYNELYYKIAENRKENISTYINSEINNINEDSLSLIIKCRKIYTIHKDMDDMELYDMFNMESNIDFSRKLAYIYLHNHKTGNKYNNIINEFVPNQGNSLVSNLISNQIVSNKMLGLLLLPSDNKQAFISTNSVACLQTTYTTTFNNPIVYCTRTLGELLLEITNEEYGNIEKQYKQQIYSTYDGTRPFTEEYHKWNGLQVYDIDLKLWNGSVDNLKAKMHELLQDFHWYLWICKSASGKGLHIYTKVTPPHHVYINPIENEYISRYWFNVNYTTKLSNIYDILDRLNKIPNNGINFPEEFENVFVDNVVRRITAGIRLTYDPMPLVNHNFLDLHPGLGLSQTLDGFEFQQTIDRIYYRQTKLNNSIIQLIDEELAVSSIDEYKSKKNTQLDLSKFIHINGDIDSVGALPRNSINYKIRYHVCNTLASIFGKDGINIAHTLLDSTNCKNVGEINSFYSCALSNRKEPSKLGIEILKKAGLIKSVEPEVMQQIDNTFKGQLKQHIEQSLSNVLIKNDINLSDIQYLSDKSEYLVKSITGNKINIIFSPPGSGKTEFIKEMAKQGKRILLVLPYISVIKNKIETDDSITKNFDTFYGSKDIKDMEYGRNAVTTFDKFSRSSYEKISKMFDYIFIDESHLLFTSAYRIEATSNVIKKIKELFYISSNDPYAAKMVLLTGTETGESYFFNQVANIIRVGKTSLDKRMEFLICDDTLDAITRLSNKAASLLNNNYRLMIPTNKGEIYSEKIIGMIEFLLQRKVKYGYYKRSNTEQEICKLINDSNTVGDYEIIFCSNYLSVGVDIKDSYKFASLYFGNFSGYEIEQFNARVRKTGIESTYCIPTSKADGTINSVLLEEPNLLLRITDDDQLYFIDDKAIAGAKTEFIACFDPVLHKIATPGFSILNGKIQFNLEEYELLSFENKYSECMEHPLKVARELSKYGYRINVSTEFEGLSNTDQQELKKMGMIAMKEEKIRKHNLLVGTFVDLINNNKYVNNYGLEYSNVIEWIGKHNDLVIEDRELCDDKGDPVYIKVIFDIFATPQQVFVRSKEALEKMYKSARFLISRYSETKALSIIYQYVNDEGILKIKYFNRALSLLKLIDSSEANELADPLVRTLEKMYDFVDQFETSADFRISFHTYRTTIENWTNEYIDCLGIRVNTMYGFEKAQNGITEMLMDVATKQTSKKGIRFTYNKLPDQDSTNVLNRRSVDSLIQNMFGLTSEIINTNSQVKKRHIILLNQNF